MKLKLSLMALAIMASAASADGTGRIPIEDVSTGRLVAPPPDFLEFEQQPASGIRIDANAIRTGIQKLQTPQYQDAIEESERIFEQVPQSTPAQTTQNEVMDKITKSWKPQQILKLSPGENIVIPVGQGLMNSIQTNFKMLAARTSDKDSILEIEDGFLYVTINNNQPVGLILYEDGVMESQVSVTLVPSSLPPTMIDITVEMSEQMLAKSEEYRKRIALEETIANEEATSGNRNTEYSDRIINLLTPVAKGDLPRGMSLTNDIPGYLTTPCQVTIYQEAGQRITGGREIIDVVLMRNDTARGYRVREEMCLSAGVKAVALFEKSYLQPGEETEVYILRDKLYEQEMARKNRRPRLTGNAN
ncbi:TraK domain-containing protein [Rheinheimera hassiensis]|uniref:TraK domain-containing protein n=1 Tax=Rheinheimera hassiensis TaxID=1193627 RepID=UPI001F05BBD1|nr:type-F conjugative transfer system secretin TraK [Rheinheimera hassiensis]